MQNHLVPILAWWAQILVIINFMLFTEKAHFNLEKDYNLNFTFKIKVYFIKYMHDS